MVNKGDKIMKRLLFSVISLLVLTATSCSKNELSTIQENTYVHTIKASIAGFGTKTTMYGNTVNWEEGDRIALLTNNGNNIAFTLTDGAGTTEGTFGTTENIEGMVFVAALYPYNQSARYYNGKISTVLPSGYDWIEGENSKAPMAALINDNNNISFKNAGSLVALTVNNIPAGYKEISLSSDKAVNGAAEIYFTAGIPSGKIISTEEANKTTTISFTPSDVPTNKLFYFPLSVKDEDENMTVVLSDGTTSQTIMYKTMTGGTVRNRRYYKTINFDAAGSLPVQLGINDNINEKILAGGANFILPKELSSIDISAETSEELQIAVTCSNNSFTITGDGAKGKINLCTPAESKILNIDVPNSTVELRPDATVATYSSITATTAENTLIIPNGVTVENLTVKGGNVKVAGIIKNINYGKSEGKVVIFKCKGAVIPENLDASKFDVIIPVDTESELNDAIANGGTVALGADIALTNPISIAAGNKVELYLNGCTLYQEKECSASYAMITNRGQLSVKGEGTIYFEDLCEGSTSHSSWGTYTIRNEGDLTIALTGKNGKIEHRGPRNLSGSGDPICYTIDNHNSGKITIDNGIISSPKSRSIRNFYTDGNIQINGGIFIGQIWIQQGNPSGSGDHTTKICSLTINGGNFSPAGADGSSVFLTNHSADNVNLSVTGGTFNTKIGCNNANHNGVKGKITGGIFTDSAKNGTNINLFATTGK